MTLMSVEVLGTVRPDGTLELDQKLTVPPGRVKVRLEPVPRGGAGASEGLADFVRRTREEAQAQGSTFMNDEEVEGWIEELRAEDDRIEG
jgi:hypothetical protein